MDLAARIDDPVAHEGKTWGGVVGAVLGGAVVVAAFILTSEVTVPAAIIAAICVTVSGTATGITVGASLGKDYLGRLFKTSGSHDIITGAAAVHTGDSLNKAARMSDKVKCHSGKTIAVGSLTVIIEGWNAARKGDATQCAGKISDGCHTVMIGGPAVARSGMGTRSETAGWFDNTIFGIDVVGSVTGLFGAKGWATGAKLALKLAGLGLKLFEKADPKDGKPTSATAGTAVKVAQILVDPKGSVANSVETIKTSAGLVSSASKINSTFIQPGGTAIPTYDDVVAGKSP